MLQDQAITTTPSPVSRATVFEARGLTKVYHMGEVDVHALKGIDLDLYEKEFVVLLGPSGSGKSTLLNILGGLDVPTSGTVRYRGKMLDSADDAALTRYRRQHVGFVFQFYNLIPSLTARENVALITEISENPMKPDEALELVGLTPRRDHFPSQMSGGEQQRVAIARAVANAPRVLLADEPTGNLDATTADTVFRELLTLVRETGMAALVATHNPELAHRMDRTVTLKDGVLSA